MSTQASSSSLRLDASGPKDAPSPNRRRRARPSSPILEEPEAEEVQDAQRRRDERPGRSAASASRGTVDSQQHHTEPKSAAAATTAELSSSQPSEAADPARKRARREDPDAKTRGARMFGLLNSTLTKFKTDAERQKTGTAAQRRASLEARLQEKLRRESHEITVKQRLETELRAYVGEAKRLAETIALREAEHRTRRAQKRRMASFLWTPGLVESDVPRYRRRGSVSSSSAAAAAAVASVGPARRDRGAKQQDEGAPDRIAPHIPSTLPPISRSANQGGDYPLYFLPYKLLPSQDDVLDEQEEKVDDEIDKADDAWDRERDRLEDRLRAVKDKMARKRKEIFDEASPEGGEKKEDGARRAEEGVGEDMDVDG
ncbi:uncharacterized protein PSFLO_02765 [Pseudozyma flocculosa]|nr:uncharacterized protein PSFLO_02765 [Pseudozyma flocculosa]